MKALLNSIKISTLAVLLSACGGGGSGEVQATAEQPVVQEITFPITPNGIATNFSQYAWNINNSTLDSQYKIDYNIDDNAHINMPTSTNNEKIKIAIIDQGFQFDHPEIYDKVIDLKYINNTVLTTDYHGTLVLGTIASTYLGVAPNNVELILINIDFDNSTDADLIAAFNYAKNQGAKIINCSWGSTYDENLSYSFSQTYLDTIASLKTAGISVVFAAGNNGVNLDNNWMDESELSSVIGVGATSVLNDITDYTNYGSNIDIVAPGGGGTNLLGILTTDLVGTEGSNNILDLVDNNYTFTAGTSFATPTISGVIALMLSENPNLTPDQIRTILIETADKIQSDSVTYTDLSDDGTTSTFNTKRAYGKVNASAAINAAKLLL